MVFAAKELLPTVVFDAPVVFAVKAILPRATLYEAVVLASSVP